MRVERAGVDQVKERLDLLKRKISDKASAPKVSASEEYENKLALQLAEEERLKRQRKEEAIARKKEKEIGVALAFRSVIKNIFIVYTV